MARLGPIALLGAALCSTGCWTFGPATVTRTVGGQQRTGIFVSPYSYEHFLRGELANLRGDLEQAAAEYRLARAGPEDDPLLIARLADVLDRLGRESEALQLLEQGEEQFPRAEPIWLTRGTIAERHERLEEASEAYSRAASSAPRSEAGPLALAELLRRQGEGEEADAVLQRYLSRGSGAGAARARLALAVDRGDAQAAAEAVRSLLDVAPARAQEVRAAARTALQAGRPELALRLSSALPDAPEDRQLRLAAALAAGQPDVAEAVLARWMPSGPGELRQVAQGYLAAGRPERAVELAQVAVSADGGPMAQLVLGRALRAAGRRGEAAGVLATIAPGSRAWPEAPIELAGVLVDAGSPALAAQVLAHAQRRSPSSLPLRLALASARVQAGEEEAALEALRGDAPVLVCARARLLERAGRVQDAAQAYAAVPADDPTLSERDRTRALVARRWREGERASAIEALREWTERAPEDLDSRARLAELLAAAADVEAAREVAGAALPLAASEPLRGRLTQIVVTAPP